MMSEACATGIVPLGFRFIRPEEKAECRMEYEYSQRLVFGGMSPFLS